MATAVNKKSIFRPILLACIVTAAFFHMVENAWGVFADDYNASLSASTCNCPVDKIPVQAPGSDPVFYVCRNASTPSSFTGQVECSAKPIASAATTSTDVVTYNGNISTFQTCNCVVPYYPDSNSNGLQCLNPTANVYTDCLTPAAANSLANAATNSTAVNIANAGANASGSQAAAMDTAANISETAASNRATIAAANCADGANSELAAAGSGADAVASCQDDFAKANALAKMAENGGKDGTLKADQGVLASSDVQTILNKFQKNFGVSKDDYLSRMLNSRGRPDELKDMTSSKFTDDKFDKMMAAAGEVKPETLAQNDGGVGEIQTEAAKNKLDTSLRDSLKKKLLVAASARDLAFSKSGGSSFARMKKITDLKPGGLEQLINGNQEQEAELSLFDVIRLKLREFAARQKL